MGGLAEDGETKLQTKNTTRKRVQFDFESRALEALDSLKSALAANTRAEVVRKALRLLGKAVEIEDQGGELVLRGKDGKERVFLL